MSAIFSPIHVLFAIGWANFRPKMSFSELYPRLPRDLGARGGPPSAARKGSLGTRFRPNSASTAILRPFAPLPRSNSSFLTGSTFGHRMGVIYVLLCFDPALEGPFMSVPSIGPGHGFWSKMSVCASERPPPAGSFMSGARLSAVISSPRAFRGPVQPSRDGKIAYK